MDTTEILKNSFEPAWVGPQAVNGCDFELVRAFGNRVYSVAKHITQDDGAAADILIKPF